MSVSPEFADLGQVLENFGAPMAENHHLTIPGDRHGTHVYTPHPQDRRKHNPNLPGCMGYFNK